MRFTAVIGRFRQVLRKANIFISYSHDSDAHVGRVGELAKRLKNRGLKVVCDQDVGDPDEGWPQWSGDQVKSAHRVLVIMTETYSRRWDGLESAGVGRGATHEAQMIYQRLYDEGRKNSFCRVVVFERADSDHIPLDLRRFTKYHAEEKFDELVEWLRTSLPVVTPEVEKAPVELAPWPPLVESFKWRMANRSEECRLFTSIMAGETERRMLFLSGESGRGKSLLVSELMRYLEYLPDCECAHIDCKDSPTDERFQNEICKDFGFQSENLCHQIESSERVRVLVIDTYEKANEELRRWVEKKLLTAVCRSRRVICVIAGQLTPMREGSRLEDESYFFKLSPITDPEIWVDFHERRENTAAIDPLFIGQLTQLAAGNPSLIRAILEGKGA